MRSDKGLVGPLAASTLALEFATAEPGTMAFVPLVKSAAMLALVLATRKRWGNGDGDGDLSTLRLLVALGVLLVLPFVVDGIGRHALGHGRPGECTMLAAFRNLGLALAAVPRVRVASGLAALVSLFMTLFAVSIGESEFVLPLAVVYGLAACAWLVTVQWERTSRHGGAALRFPWIGAGVSVTAVLVACGAPALVNEAAGVFAGFMPTSGGTDWSDPGARGGVNDGDDEVRGTKSAQSVGFVESDLYLSSKKPSLYDAINEQFGEPLRTTRQERAIGLGPQDAVRELDGEPREVHQGGREFSTVRRTPQRAKRPRDLRAAAMLYVQGRTPVHLRLAAYDRFDGLAWHEAPYVTKRLELEHEPKSRWLRVLGPISDIYSRPVEHRIKIGLFESSHLPTPAHVTRFRVGAVDRPDFFAWAQDGILRMAGRSMPSGNAVETDANLVHPGRLHELSWPVVAQAGSDPCTQAHPGRPAEALAELVRRWTGNLPRGWAQVEAVANGLRENFTHDATVCMPEECTDAIEHFLSERRGPSYLFASTATLALRSLGYPARVVSGFYASPFDYNPRSRNTVVTSDDAHFWTEVRLPNGTWAALEPTPGYELLTAQPTWGDRLAAASLGVGRWLWARRVAAGVVLLCATAVVCFRRELFDAVATLIWRVQSHDPPHDLALRTLRLIERRAGWAGRARPSSATPGRWLRPLAGNELPERFDSLMTIVALAERAAFAPATTWTCANASPHQVRLECARALRHWTLRRLRALSKTMANGSRCNEQLHSYVRFSRGRTE